MHNRPKHHIDKTRVIGLIFAKANLFIFVPRTWTVLPTADNFLTMRSAGHMTGDWIKMKLPSPM